VSGQLPKERALAKLREQLVQIPNIRSQGRFSAEFKKWHRDTQVAIERIFGKEGRHLKDFNNVRYSLMVASTGTPDYAFEKAFRDGLDGAKPVLESFIAENEEYWDTDDDQESSKPPDAVARLSSICGRFHLVARQLRDRHNNRTTIAIEDEYDVQDLLHSLLHLSFDDVRREEWTPSYAGGASRVDILLRPERILVEAKKTRQSLSTKALGDQLIIDIQRYQTHPNCDHLFCFVYDPEGRIGNPRGLESDLSKKHGNIMVTVQVAPRAS
jgi:hypothetical protein